VSSGKFLYAANGGLSILPDPAKSNNISAFTINSATGALLEMPGSPFKTCTGPRRLTSDPSGKYLLVSCTDAKLIQVYRIAASGALTPVGNAISTGGLNWDIGVEPSGRFVYVTFGDLQRVSIYSLNATSGALAKIKDVSVSGSPRYVGMDTSGKLLFVLIATHDNKTAVAAYTIDASGSLKLASGPFTTSDTGFPEVGMSVMNRAQ